MENQTGKSCGLELPTKGFLLLKEEGETFWLCACLGVDGNLLQESFTPREAASNILFLWGIFKQEQGKGTPELDAAIPLIEDFIEKASLMFPRIDEEIGKLREEARILALTMNPGTTTDSLN